MKEQRYLRLNPGALAIAGGIGALVVGLTSGLAMMGFGSMMGGYAMGGYGGYHMGTSAGLAMLFWVFILGAIAGAAVAWTYNTVVARDERATSTTELETRPPNATPRKPSGEITR